MKTIIEDLGLALAMAAVILLGTACWSTNHDSEADAITDQISADLADESRSLQLAVYVAEHDTAAGRAQHPSATEPVRRRHPSTLPESDQ